MSHLMRKICEILEIKYEFLRGLKGLKVLQLSKVNNMS